MTGTVALEVTVTAPVTSFRNPLYAGVQVGLPCPPPATVGGMLASAAGGWAAVDSDLRFAMAFHAQGAGEDLETYHPLDARGKSTDAKPRLRAFLADARLTVWLLDDVDRWRARLRRPVWPLRLGRSQDLVGLRLHQATLRQAPGIQGAAVLPAETSDRGTLLRLPSAVALDRSRTRWDTFRFDPSGSADNLATDGWSTADGRAVVVLPHTHPYRFDDAGR